MDRDHEPREELMKNRNPHHEIRQGRERGSALLLATLLVVVAVGLSYSTIFLSVSEVEKSRLVADKTRAFYAAEAGMELGINVLKEYTQKTTIGEAFKAMDSLFVDGEGNKALNRVYVDHDLVHNNKTYGTVNVQFSLAGSDSTHRDITLTVDSYVPNRYVTVNGKQVERFQAHTRIEKTVRVEVRSAQVFDYSYFINNWGWFYGDSITANGNVRSNGQFDAGGRRPTINGIPRYTDLVVSRDPNTGAVTADLKGYHDDNRDGVKDGSDGGVYSGWNIEGSDKIRGMAALPENKHEYVESVTMPNLNDMSLYETLAKNRVVDGKVVPSSITVGSVKIDSVFGDDPTESGNLYLYGTDADPIVLDGPVVVKGHLIIFGKVTGQGSLYVEGNVYIPGNLEYVNPPSTWAPDSNSEADTEKWIAENYDKDSLGLFAKENIIVGDYTDETWRKNVGSWLEHPQNASKEDSGTDLIPNTRDGRDGIANTPDDDVLEGDGVWTVRRYTMDDYYAGIIKRSQVGEPIPGTGEDIDGDGVFDDTITLADFDNRPLNSGQYGGNVRNPAIPDYSLIGRTDVSQIDGALYTNHALGLYTTSDMTFNGAMISRNESIVFGDAFTINYDRRLLGGGGNPDAFLPQVFDAISEASFLQTDLLGLAKSSSVPLVPPIEERIAVDPTAGGETGLVLTPVTLTTK